MKSRSQVVYRPEERVMRLFVHVVRLSPEESHISATRSLIADVVGASRQPDNAERHSIITRACVLTSGEARTAAASVGLARRSEVGSQ